MEKTDTEALFGIGIQKISSGGSSLSAAHCCNRRIPFLFRLVALLLDNVAYEARVNGIGVTCPPLGHDYESKADGRLLKPHVDQQKVSHHAQANDF